MIIIKIQSGSLKAYIKTCVVRNVRSRLRKACCLNVLWSFSFPLLAQTFFYLLFLTNVLAFLVCLLHYSFLFLLSFFFNQEHFLCPQLENSLTGFGFGHPEVTAGMLLVTNKRMNEISNPTQVLRPIDRPEGKLASWHESKADPAKYAVMRSLCRNVQLQWFRRNRERIRYEEEIQWNKVDEHFQTTDLASGRISKQFLSWCVPQLRFQVRPRPRQPLRFLQTRRLRKQKLLLA